MFFLPMELYLHTVPKRVITVHTGNIVSSLFVMLSVFRCSDWCQDDQGLQRKTKITSDWFKPKSRVLPVSPLPTHF